MGKRIIIKIYIESSFRAVDEFECEDVFMGERTCREYKYITKIPLEEGYRIKNYIIDKDTLIIKLEYIKGYMMVKFKISISNPKNGKAETIEVEEPYSLNLIGKKVGDIIDGSQIGTKYKKLKITGGSDKSGFPMRPDIPGGRKLYILARKGIGLKTIKGKSKKGFRKRILVRGNTITPDIYQVNMVIVE